MTTGSVPVIFDRVARRQRRDRAGGAARDELEAHIRDLVLERLDAVKRGFDTALVVNTGGGLLADALQMRTMHVTETDIGPRTSGRRRAICGDEDRLDLPAATFDLIVIPWGLDTVDDLPGALLLARRALRPDGLLLAVLVGAPSLPMLRASVAVADGDRAVARIHPQIDVRAAGDLLARVGLSLAVADTETLTLGYRSAARLIEDLRAVGATNVLAERHPVSRRWLAAQAKAFAEPAERTLETITLIVLTGWAPPQ